ncbi:MAG: chromate transporter [candidate division GAL15 bacterium]
MRFFPVPGATSAESPDSSLAEVARVFLKLGTVAFGGPAAHIAMMREEVVLRRRWLSDQHFLDLLGITNLIPGPNSTEMAIQVGYLRAGWRGFLVAGVCFILPAALMVGALASVYVAYGSTPQADWLLYGIKPVVLAIVVHALLGLGRTAVRTPLAVVWAASMFALYLAGVHELVLLFVGGALFAALQRPGSGSGVVLPGLVAAPAASLGVKAAAAPVSLAGLFDIFLKIGSVLYGSGYVLLAFLRRDLVERLGWLTDRQLLDAVAVGQFTPGPLFTTATFVGYLLAGPAGAVVATVGIFLPSFVFVAAVQPLAPRLRRSPWASAILDGVNLTSLALMAGVAVQLAQTALTDAFTVSLAVGAVGMLVRFRVNSAWLVAAAALLAVGVRVWTR